MATILQRPFAARLTSMGRERDRWCIILPPSVSQQLDKAQAVVVTVRPTGSLFSVRRGRPPHGTTPVLAGTVAPRPRYRAIPWREAHVG